jgi:hypothetical protein
MRVKPRAGLRVPYPQNPIQALPAEGGNVPEDNYWMRRLRDGDVVRIDDPPKKPELMSAAPVDINEPEPSGREPVAPLTTR